MIPLKTEENQSYFEQNICYICKKKNLVIMVKNTTK